MRLILHAGVPKTGTTALQAHLRAHDAALAAAGVRFVRRFPNFGEVDPLFPLLRALRRSPGEVGLVAAARDRLAALSRGARAVLISYEDAFGRAAEDGFFSPRLPGMARDLAHVLEGRRLSVVVTLRRQEELIASYAVQDLRKGSVRPLEVALEKIDPAAVSWRPYLCALAEAFPAAASCVLHYDRVRAAPDLVAEAILAHAGVTAGLGPVRGRKNRSFPIAGRARALAINRVWARAPAAIRQSLPLDRVRRAAVESAARFPAFRPGPGAAEARLADIGAALCAENDVIAAASGGAFADVLSALDRSLRR